MNSQSKFYQRLLRAMAPSRKLLVHLAIPVLWGSLNSASADESPNATEILSLQGLLNAVVESNNSLKMAQLEEVIASEGVTERLEIFEPTLTVRSSVGRTLSPLSVEDQLLGRSPDPYPDNESMLEGEVSKLLKWGTTLSINSSIKRQKTGDLDDYQYRGRAGASLVHPLIRGAGTDITRIDVSIAEVEAKIRTHSSLDQTNAIITQATLIYIDAVNNQLILNKLKSRLEVLTQLKGEISTLINGGRLPLSSALDLEINLTKLANLISTTERDLARLKTELRNLAPKVNLTPDKLQVDISILPTDTSPIPSQQQLYDIAVNTRHDLKTQKLEIKRALLKLERASDMTRDTFNIRLDAGLTNQAETAGGAMSTNDLVSHPEGRISIEYKTLLGDKAGANARFRIAELEKRNAELLLQDQLQILRNEVQSAHSAAVKTEEIWLKTKEISEAVNEQYILASSRITQGRGSIIEALQSKERKLEAAMNEIEASTQYLKALIQLYATQGDLSEQLHGILKKK